MKPTARRISAAAAALLLAGQLVLPAGALWGLGDGDSLTISQAFSDPRLVAWLEDGRNLNGAGADGVLTLAERQAVTELDLSGQGLTSLEGLEAFPNLERLDCSQNQLTQLELGGNPALERLDCSYNRLTRLELGGNPRLAYLTCGYNRLTQLDLSGHSALVALNCEMNQLTQLELAGCTGLVNLYCRNNLLEELNLEDNTALEFIETFSNQLTRIEVSHLTNLRFLHIDHNRLTSLDMSGNGKLEGGGFVARNNFMETILLPHQPGLTVYLDDYEEQDPVEGSDRAEWFLDPDFQTPAPQELEAEGQTLYSRRVPNRYTVYFSPNGGTGAMEPHSARWGESFSLEENQFQRRGYTFANWSRLSGEDYQPLADGQQVSNLAGRWSDRDRVTLYARWTPSRYTILLDGNGADGGDMERQAATYGVSLRLPDNTYEKADREFAGWALEPDGPVRYPDGANVLNLTHETGEVTLYAVWKEPLSEQQKPYLLQLEQAFQTLASAQGNVLPYTAQDWDDLSGAHARAAAEIGAAQDASAMQAAPDGGIAAMEAVPTAVERVDQVVGGWEEANAGALDYLAGGGLTQDNARQALSLADEALEDAGQDRLVRYCPLEREEDRALILGAASARLQGGVESLRNLRQGARWLSGLEEGLISRPMDRVYAQDLERYQSALAAWDGLDESVTQLISPDVRAQLSARCLLAGQKRSAEQSLRQACETLDPEDYSADGRAALAQALDAGLEAIRTADSADGVQQARREAWTALSQVPTADREPVLPPDNGGGEGSGGTGGSGGAGGGGTPPADKPEEPGEDGVIQVTDDRTGASAVVSTAPDGAVRAQVTLPQGVDGVRFAPNLSMTRAMVVTVLHKLEGNPAPDRAHAFEDVPAGAWYAQAAAWAAEQGITGGVGDSAFAPDAPISREALALMLYRCARQMDLPVSKAPLTGFGDEDRVSSWAREAVEWACAGGILSRDNLGNLNPGAVTTRAEVAAMLTRFVELATLA